MYRGAGSALQRALIGWFLDVHTREHGMTEVWPPALVNADSARGTGQIPDKEDQMYVVDRDGLYLVPTAEVPVTNLHRDEILDAAELPMRYAAYSPCFRREAGAAGRDTRGILRVHQFDKVEMVSSCKPEDSPPSWSGSPSAPRRLLQRLGLAYRVILMATREMGFVQARKYDLEVWAPGVERWLEVSSVSNFRDYQARRMGIRHRPAAEAKPELVHTLNGSALALARTVAALLETHQRADGSVGLPEPLHTRWARPRFPPEPRLRTVVRLPQAWRRAPRDGLKRQPSAAAGHDDPADAERAADEGERRGHLVEHEPGEADGDRWHEGRSCSRGGRRSFGSGRTPRS